MARKQTLEEKLWEQWKEEKKKQNTRKPKVENVEVEQD